MARVEVDGTESILVETQSIDIPKTAILLSTLGREPVEILGMQNDPTLEESGVVRFGDAYGRNGG